MRIVNGYRVYDREELENKGGLWYTRDTKELMSMGYKYHGGYRTSEEFYSDKEAVEKLHKDVTEEMRLDYYRSEAHGWIIYIFVVVFGNIFKYFFPWGMIYATIYFAKWRKDFHGTYYKG